MKFISASQFNIEQLTLAYNLTRVDYIVPMPMNAKRLADYLHLYDVDLACSWVAVDDDRRLSRSHPLTKESELIGGDMPNILGLGMLGVREDEAWITRLGVLPAGRQQGIGRAITQRLMSSAAGISCETIWLEVIEGNKPAYRLFSTSGFEKTRELVVARRPPDILQKESSSGIKHENVKSVRSLGRDEIINLLDNRPGRPNWLIETETMKNVKELAGLVVTLPGNCSGWVAYRLGQAQISSIVVGVLAGDPAQVTHSTLETLHREYPRHDAVMENISTDDETWPGFLEAGYFENFRRIEMIHKLS